VQKIEINYFKNMKKTQLIGIPLIVNQIQKKKKIMKKKREI